MKRMKRMISLLVGCVMCTSIVLPHITTGNNVQASDLGTYVVNLPTEGTITNVQSTEGSMQFIDVTFADESVGEALANAVTITDAAGNEVNAVYFSVEGKVRIPLSNFASSATYTLSITPEGFSEYTGSFTTGDIVDDTDVADGLEVQKKLTYSVMDLLRGYDLDSVTITTEDSVGAEVYLTRDLQQDFSDMTLLGTISENEQTFEITGYNIAKYQYVIVKGNETVSEIKAYVSSDSMKGIKARPIGGDNVDIRFSSWSDLHLREGQREVTNMTEALVKAKSEEFGGHLDALVLVGDINMIETGNSGSNLLEDQMLRRYARLETILTENGYGYSNLDNDKDDIIPVIFSAGNHEYQVKKNNDTHKGWFVNQVDSFNSHKEINGYHFIAGSTNYDAMMEEETTTWMKAEIEKAIADDPTGTKPIFVFAHSKAIHTVGYNTTNATNTTYYPGTGAEFVEWMKDYPQIVYFSGHNHYAMQQQTTIKQDGFTQIMLGLMGGSDIGYPGNTTDTGFYREEINSMGDDSYHPQGAIIEVKNNVAYVYKIDYRTGEHIGDPWVIDTEGLSEGTSRQYYTIERTKFSVAPEFPEGAEEEIEVAYTTTQTTADTGDVITSMDATITFPQATCDGIYGDKYPLVYHLKIYDKETGVLCNVYSHYSDAIYWTNNYEMSDTFTLDVPELQVGREYRVDILARNSFNKFGEPISVDLNYKPDGQLSEEELNKSIPEATIQDTNYYETEADGYKFFGNVAGDTSTVATETSTYSLEAAFHVAMNKSGRLVGTDAHNLSITSSSSTYYLTYTYTVDGVAQTLQTTSYYPETLVDVVATCDGTAAKLYVDGVLVDAAAISGTVDVLTGDITVGSSVCASILKARVYDRAITIGEIAKLSAETDTIKPTGSWVELLSPAAISMTNGGNVYYGKLANVIDGDTSTQVQLSGSPREMVIDLGTAYELKTCTFYSTYLDTTGNQKITIESSETDTGERTVLYSTVDSGELTAKSTKYISASGAARYLYLSTTNGTQLFVVNEVRIFGKAITTQAEY